MDLILSVDQARRAKRMSQTEIADELAVTQGHYSKVLTRRAPLSAKLAERMEAWLSEGGHKPIGDSASRRINQLAMSIRRQCMELTHLVGLAESEESGR
ncbi:helix-turn-helix domain-containing protein [Sphingomonas sp. LB-2]|uniref:helix-turn-helix domain-containing protein n=1 Tax=Sphingomonas caeni TaxID=2984949 RepID=UPI0022324A9B|nr:helix-turn-helix transcriptional regulator [Sphingomonas caeni]MCW3847383.1 helix-turn-helix domain-containing protein [Sphingomonas caeni]